MALLSPKKLKKLKENPRAFFVDAFKKKAFPIKNALKRLKPKKKQGFAKYAIISAVYNVEKYLDDYFKSIINQRLDFKNNILIICVDDGSTDNSAQIIKKYQKKFPQNIIYLHKENGGQASARNLGLEFLRQITEGGEAVDCHALRARNDENAQNDKNLDCHAALAVTNKFKEISWVTFTDPDDFLDFNYFYEVDRFIKNNQHPSPSSKPKLTTQPNPKQPVKSTSQNPQVSAQLIFIKTQHILYHEKNGKLTRDFFDFHIGARRILSNDKLERHFFFFSSSSLLLLKPLLSLNLRFDTELKPCFEDAKFNCEFLSALPQAHSAFLYTAKYYYRKRKQEGSSIDGIMLKKDRYLRVLKQGYLALLEQSFRRVQSSQKVQEVPNFIQNCVLYDALWCIDFLINHEERAFFLNTQEKAEFLELLDAIFQFISAKNIINLKHNYSWYHKIGLLSCFKKENPPYQIGFLNFSQHPIKNQAYIIYFSQYPANDFEIYINGVKIKPDFAQSTKHYFLKRAFLYEKIIYFRLEGKPKSFDSQELELFIDGSRAYIHHYTGPEKRQFFKSYPLQNLFSKDSN